MGLDFQTGVAFGMLAIVLVYLANRFVISPIKRKSSKHDCGPDCNCS